MAVRTITIATLLTMTCAAFQLLASDRAAGSQAVASQNPRERRSVWDGVYTEAQARRGRDAYDYSCSTCHLPDLEGDSGRDVPPLAGEPFVDEWSKHSVKDLFELISKSMPRDSPGSLRAQSYVDVVAYLLQANEFPSGATELPTDPSVLERIAIEKTAPRR